MRSGRSGSGARCQGRGSKISRGGFRAEGGKQTGFNSEVERGWSGGVDRSRVGSG